MSEPKRHHFLPVFYLRQWAREGGRLVQYSQPYQDTVVPKRVHPEGTGYIDRLYAVLGLPEPEALKFEKAFLSPVDSKAAEALVIMRGEHAAVNFTPKQRWAWAGFLTSLMSRMPTDIAKVKEHVKGEWLAGIPELQEKYFAAKAANDPDSVFDYIKASDDTFYQQGAMAILEKIMSHKTVAQAMVGMEWSVLTVERANHKLLTSDRPIIYTPHMTGDDSHMLLPISPHEIFVAVRKREFSEKIKARGQIDLVHILNKKIVGEAETYVYGNDDSQLRFVQNRMGKSRTTALVDRLHQMRLKRNAELKVSKLPG